MKIPTVVANLEKNGEPALKDSKIARSIVLKVGNRRVGVIGALYDKTHVSYRSLLYLQFLIYSGDIILL